MPSNILVFIERRDGQIKRPGLEALSTARRLAGDSGEVTALALGPGASGGLEELGRHGADVVRTVEDEHLGLYAAEAYAAELAAAAEQGEAAVVLLPATIMGKDLAARSAARLGCACVSELVEVELDGDGVLRGKRPVYSGKAFARVRVSAAPVVATLRPNVFEVVAVDSPGTPRHVEQPATLAADRLRVVVTELRTPEKQELDVSEAAIVVAGGRGLKEPENFSVVRELADALGGAVGASRAVVDAGWIEHARQVGQTGKVVSPSLYVAVGISGAIQHLAGMSSSRVIVAINKDAEAPIFKVADYGIVGDLFEVLPALTAAVKAQTSS